MKRILFFLLFTCHFLGQAQQDTLPDVFLNPRDVITNHLFYLQDATFNDLQSAKSLARTNLSRSKRAELALEIKQILDGTANYIELGEVPNDPDYIDTLSNENKYILTEEYPQIYVQKYGRVWLYSQETVKAVDDLHRKLFPFGASKLLKQFRPSESKKFLGIHYWQYIFTSILIAGLILVYYVLLFVFKRLLLKKLAHWVHVEVAQNKLHPLASPLVYIIVLSLLFRTVPILQLPPFIGQFILGTIKVLFVVFTTGFFLRLTDVGEFYGIVLAKKSESTLDDHIVPLLSKVLKGVIVVIGFIAMLNAIGVEILPLLTGISIGGLAFALAAQDTLKNFFGSLMIFLDKPFQIGDWITEGNDIDGTVEEVGLRSTRIRTFRDSVVYVPNGQIANGRVDNHGLRRYRRFYTTINITYDTPARIIEVFVEGLRRIVDEHPDTRKDYYNIYLNDYMDSSLKIMFYVFFEVPDWPNELRCRQEIMLEINKLAEHLGVRFAFPTQTLHVEEMPGQLSLTPNYKETEEKYRAQLDTYFEQKNKN